jgi:hypothetical protein
VASKFQNKKIPDLTIFLRENGNFVREYSSPPPLFFSFSHFRHISQKNKPCPEQLAWQYFNGKILKI